MKLRRVIFTFDDNSSVQIRPAEQTAWVVGTKRPVQIYCFPLKPTEASAKKAFQFAKNKADREEYSHAHIKVEWNESES